MKFRHNIGVRLSLTSGHVTFVGPDWRSLHERFHTEALSKGCECDQGTIRTRTLAQPIAGPNAVTPLNEPAAIRAALIRMLERNGEDDFNNDGLPSLKALAAECGFRVEKGAALAVWHELEEEARVAQEPAGQELSGEEQEPEPDAGKGESAQQSPESNAPPKGNARKGRVVE